MATLDIALFAPSHAVEPALLAQQLPCLAAVLRNFCTLPAQIETVSLSHNSPHTPQIIQVYAAQLGIQRAYITLEALPQLPAQEYGILQAHTVLIAKEFAAEGLQFTPNPSINHHNPWALGTLNLKLAKPLPLAANFMGRDIAHALPRDLNDTVAKTLRQFVNVAQMSLHQSPVMSINSLWCCAELPSAPLAQAWLQGGLAIWWDTLPAWDMQFNTMCLSGITQLRLVFSDVVLTVPLKPRHAWALWQKPLLLSDVLNHLN
jgi:hypothetical protein